MKAMCGGMHSSSPGRCRDLRVDECSKLCNKGIGASVVLGIEEMVRATVW